MKFKKIPPRAWGTWMCHAKQEPLNVKFGGSSVVFQIYGLPLYAH